MERRLDLVLCLSLLVIGQSACFTMNRVLTNTRSFQAVAPILISQRSWSGYRNRLKQFLHRYATLKLNPSSLRMRGFTPVQRTKETRQLYNDARFSSMFIKRAAILNTGIRNYACDTTRLTLQTIIEYVKSGSICGFQISGVRFGLGK